MSIVNAIIPWCVCVCVCVLRFIGSATWPAMNAVCVPGVQQVAKRAVRGLWDRRSALGLVGNHINIFTGGAQHLRWLQLLQLIAAYAIDCHRPYSTALACQFLQRSRSRHAA